MRGRLVGYARSSWLLTSLGLLILLMLPSPASAALNQQVSCSFSSASSTCALPTPVATGDLLVIVLTSWNSPAVSDSLKSPWSQATAVNNASIWYAVTSASGSEQVTIGTGGGGVLLDYSGHWALDVAASQANAVGAKVISSGSYTTTQSGDLLIGAMFGNGWSGIHAGSGYTIEAASDNGVAEDQIQSAAGPASATFTQPGWGGASTVLLAAFKDPPSSKLTTKTSLTVNASWDSGAPVGAQVVLAQASSGTSPTTLLSENLVNGISPSISANLAANTTYLVTLTCSADTTGACANGTVLYQFPFATIFINPSNLQSGVINLVFRKTDLTLKTAQINVGMAF